MKRITLSVLWGILPALAILLVVQTSLSSQERDLRAVASPTLPVNPAPVVRTAPRAIGSLLTAWRGARESPLESIAFLEGLQTAEVLDLLAALDDEELSELRSKAARQRLFDRLVDCDLGSALEFAEQFPMEERLPLLDYLVERWAFDDPDACWSWFDRESVNLSDGQRRSLNRTIAETRSTSSPTDRELATAWETIENSHPELSSSVFAKRFFWALVNDARENGAWVSTAERLLALPDPGVSDMWPVMHQWLDHDFEGATAWLAGLPEGKQRSAVIRAMAYDPNKVAYQGQFDRGRLFDALIAMGEEDFSSDFKTWARMQPIDAGQWLSAHPEPTPALEDAREAYAESIARVDSQAATEWAASLRDEAQRERTLRGVCRWWYRTEPWAAEAWAREHLGWSDKEFERFLW